MHTLVCGMEWTIYSSNLTVAGDIMREMDSVISKYPVVSSVLSISEKSITHGAIICNGLILQVANDIINY